MKKYIDYNGLIKIQPMTTPKTLFFYIDDVNGACGKQPEYNTHIRFTK